MNDFLNVPRTRESYVFVMIQGCVHDDGYFILKEFKPDNHLLEKLRLLKKCFHSDSIEELVLVPQGAFENAFLFSILATFSTVKNLLCNGKFHGCSS